MMLKNRIFISTVNTTKSAEIKRVFEPLGATIVDFPMIEIVAADLSPSIRSAICHMDDFDWVIFTSANGASYFYSFFRDVSGNRNLSTSTKIAVVGASTAKMVKALDRQANYISTGNTAEDMIDEMLEKQLVDGKDILLPLGNLAPDTAQQKLSGIARVTRIDVYKTIRAQQVDFDKLDTITSDKYDLILFTSPSGVDNFVVTMGKENIHPKLRIASIGKVTTQAAEKHGLKCLITAEISTYEGLSEEIVNYYKR
jgi:uroporphyrinogen-III synthase